MFNTISNSDLVYLIKIIRILNEKKKIGRSVLAQQLDLGEGSVRRFVNNLKTNKIIETSNAGMCLTSKGRTICSKLYSVIPAEMNISKCDIAIGKFNHVILVRNLAHHVKTGLEQRDSAIKKGAIGATTMIFKKGKIMMPNVNQEFFRKELDLHNLMMEKLNPQEDDLIIIGSADKKKIAEFATLGVVLELIVKHKKQPI